MQSSNRPSYVWPIVTALLALVVTLVALPSEWKTWAPGFIQAPSLHLGLDLAGGTQLDFRISEEELAEEMRTVQAQLDAAEANQASTETLDSFRMQLLALQTQQTNIVEAIRTVLEKRINGLGVSEATITPSYVGNEKHLLVDCPGVIDVQKCIETVGKTIKLEFKEEFTEVTAEYEAQVRGRADDVFARLASSGDTLKKIGEDIGSDLGLSYVDQQLYFKDELPKGLESLWNRRSDQSPVKLDGTVVVPQLDAQGQPQQVNVPGVFLAEVTGPRTMTGRVLDMTEEAFAQLKNEDASLDVSRDENAQLDDLPAALATAIRSGTPGQLQTVSMGSGSTAVLFIRNYVPGQEKVDVSHILVSYVGALRAEEGVTRTKDEALARARELKGRLAAGSTFESVARAESDGPSKSAAGSLGEISHGDVAPAFEAVAFSAEPGVVSDPIETAFGYHLIRVNAKPTKTPDVAGYDLLTVNGPDSETRAKDLITRLQSGGVMRQEEAVPLRLLFFSLQPTGWKDTQLDGSHFRAAAVTSDPTTGLPVVQITFDEEGAKLFGELTKANLRKRIAIFVGGELVTAPTVQTEITNGVAIISGSQTFEQARTLAQDLNTGSIPAPIYLSGQRTVEPTLGAQALAISLQASLVGLVITMIYLVLMYRMLGLVANAALVIYGVLFFALMKLPLLLVTQQYVVLTLAGIAGTILSMGMSVDLNVLIFERMREELRKGKSFKTAAEIGFDRAWPSIRDSNISTLITCAILFAIGTSIVRGFAVTLSLGIIVSMITGVTITRWLVRLIGKTSLADRPALFGASKRQ